MSDNEVTITIDGVEVTVPAGTLVVDAAKRIGNDIPVFCYHPKMKPVGMCRMCLVEIGLPVRDRESGKVVLNEDGTPKINFGRSLQTGCTVVVAEGMVVRTASEAVTAARDHMLEFLLTSHPLDCPICDKGGECPLQNLTMRHGPGASRFDFEMKMKLGKRVPLGELIVLDRERCIQCARCTRFQDEIVDDPVIGFHNRGRALEIVTFSDPGFDSYFSGNTTDICPVGALTTTDFRFQARPWELTPVASICHHCPVGCNITMSTRPERVAGGRNVIKRIMPRQNEYVNEIWICDKGRFVHHYADSGDRLQKPLVRQNGELVETNWQEALDLVAGRLQVQKGAMAGLAGDRLSNEDLFLFQKLLRQGLGSNNLDLANKRLAGGDVAAQVGLSSDSDLKQLGAGDAVLVVAADLHEEAPIWWLRLKQAAERGAALVVMNVRPTRLDKFASHVVRFAPGHALSTARQLLNAAKIELKTVGDNGATLAAAAEALVKARNLVIYYGGEGLTYSETGTLARTLANLLLVRTGGDGRDVNHAGRPNNGLVPVWPHGNTQGSWDMGIRPDFGPGYARLEQPGMDAAAIYDAVGEGELKALYVAGSDPVGDGLMAGRGELDFLVVQDLFLTETAQQADVVLPAQSWAEREGAFTNGERRVQRFYQAIPAVGESRPDWQIFAQVGERLGLGKPAFAASLVFRDLAAEIPQYGGMDYRSLAWTEEQWPDVGGQDLYYGGTAYENKSGLGLQWPAAAETGPVPMFELPDLDVSGLRGFPVVRTAALYNSGALIERTELIKLRIAKPTLYLNSTDARRLQIAAGDALTLPGRGRELQVTAAISEAVPAGMALVRGVPYREGLIVLPELAKAVSREQ
jgi:NADH-quinone oxidoreductase subunit G